MKNEEQLKVVYIVTCYQNITGIYANAEDAHQAQNDLINKARPADVLCRPIIYPFTPKS